ncbi:MAG: hypothetical protein COV32_00995 [Candidatus Yonathbacteria bacterium CG10_big_fil_rev_8_21_14_0_10_43_136]|uniref:Uncharacterized protein n=1 Tax=Candidatus Yonathbacteria bacterium CG_4_10_14_0_8_um_filter_43_17 TaxID=1975099 RepID=A0A2M7Q677_9BACT|nr:MAG: hypothetical protein COW60_01080 [Candidatus Yonathbacteria bacterium CG17_big_fil_post_rev_8_21_14_2_50_43_9]PIR40865.1 MAG: hypothetical protein COV32_00995 [Candidatus Yonathbacteria bacterium CG10_big_fil_rev_8_21_14_0_10_43_136]PIX57127.1 MAG: hypothetical protein COZ48_02295 [Candidatus Yonathbacteria bacterium CG_4_10_14_3_um_filter_43_12]PIY58464.1 MAG: hypothetical protein COY98_01870 [Candidatus Yonathbacteria bacterium CG_4_10_14_0_8_um_filter_43_17]PJC22093.1 MAG: hypothetic
MINSLLWVLLILVIMTASLGSLYFLKFNKSTPAVGGNSSQPKQPTAIGKIYAGWGKMTPNSKKRVWLIILSVIAILVATASIPKSAPSESSPENIYLWAGIIALLGVHIIWAVYSFSEKVSWMETTILYGIIFFYGLTLVFPQVVPIRDALWGLTNKALTGTQKVIVSINEKYGETPSAPQGQQSASAPAAYQPQTRVIEVTATEDRFTEVKIPPGVQFSIDCPDDGLAKVFHRDAQQGIIYDCAQNVEVGENLHNFRIGFSSKTETPVLVRVRITS